MNTSRLHEKTSKNQREDKPASLSMSDEDRIMEHLREQHPEWVDEDGSCQPCVGFLNEVAENFTGFIGKLFSR